MHGPAVTPDAFSIEDAKFDQLFPAAIRRLSEIFWTPVAVAAQAAAWLVSAPGTRVLDIGCGPGKFCLVAASLTDGRFSGVEQRPELVRAAQEAARRMQLENVQFLHANVAGLSFAGYDAFYLFNPFAENVSGYKMANDVPLSAALFRKYTRHVAEELGARPLGTRVVTYMGYADDVPDCYDCEQTSFGDDLKLWIKRRAHDPMLAQLNLRPSRSYRGARGWEAPRITR